MAVKGSNAKIDIANKIKAAFGDDFICVSDGKVYVWGNDGSEKVQVAISMTCPKVQMNAGTGVKSAPVPTSSNADAAPWEVPVEAPPAKISDEELETIEKLIAKFSL